MGSVLSFPQHKHSGSGSVLLCIARRNCPERHCQREAGHIRCVPRGSEPPAVLERPAEGPNVAGVGVGRAEHIARSVEIRLPVSE